MASLHQQRTHPVYETGCFACHISSVQLGGEPSEPKKREAQWAKDLPAYKRLRRDGLQPKSTEGAAALERDATTEFEIRTGRTYQGERARQLQEAISIVEDGTGRSIFEPVTTPKAS